MRRAEDLPELRKTRKITAVFWCIQVDAAAKVGVEVDGGGGAPRLGDSRKTKQKGTKGRERK